jgi:hypothetical protein
MAIGRSPIVPSDSTTWICHRLSYVKRDAKGRNSRQIKLFRRQFRLGIRCPTRAIARKTKGGTVTDAAPKHFWRVEFSL